MRIGSSVAIALALLGAAGAASGQGTATLYGRSNLDLEAVRALRTDGNDSWGARLSSNSSRIGLRGTEALGGGQEVIWQIESSVSADAGGGTLAGRDSFLGFRGGWGTLRFGNMKTPYDQVNGVFGNCRRSRVPSSTPSRCTATVPACRAAAGPTARRTRCATTFPASG